MGRKTGSTTPSVFAVSTSALRRIDGPGDLRPGEVGVEIRLRRQSIVTAVMPLPFPSELHLELWRLKTQKGFSYGQIVRSPAVGRRLAPRSRAKDPESSRLTLAKRYVAEVNAFLATPIGTAIQASKSWREWLTTGVDPNQLTLRPFDGFTDGEDFKANYLAFQDTRTPRKRR